MRDLLQRNSGWLLGAWILVVLVAVLVLWSGTQPSDLSWRYEPVRKTSWRLVEAVRPPSRYVRIATDGWACDGTEPRGKAAVTEAADTITIALTVQNAASNCIQQRAVFVHLTVMLALPVDNRRLVDPMVFSTVSTTMPASP